MKITEIILVPSKSQDTTSCGTTSSVIKGNSTQDIVSQNQVSKTFEGTHQQEAASCWVEEERVEKEINACLTRKLSYLRVGRPKLSIKMI